jgi:hypothetical protein
MKFSIAVVATTLAVSQAFMVAPSGGNVHTTQLAMDRRELFSSAAALAISGVVLGGPQAAFADYEPRFDDMKQIYYFGASLDRLVDKISNQDTVEAGLEGVRMFNRDSNFYTGYAKNFVLKIIGKGADSDPRVGYVKNVSIQYSSLFCFGRRRRRRRRDGFVPKSAYVVMVVHSTHPLVLCRFVSTTKYI